MKFDKFRNRILELICRAGRKGLTVPEIAKRLGPKRHTRVSPRCSELRQMGKVGAHGKRKDPASGKDNAVLVVTKYLSPSERRFEKQLRDLWEVRRNVNRRMAKLSLDRKIVVFRTFLSQISK